MTRIDPGVSFSIARALGAASMRAQGGPLSAGGLMVRAEGVRDTVELSGARRLVAGVVPGGIDGARMAGGVASAGLALHGSAAERHAAATGVTVGRLIDLEA